MYGTLDLERFALLRSTFSVAGRRDDDRPGIQEWAAAIGVNRGYFAAIKATSAHLPLAIETAAGFRGLDPVRLSRWLHGYEDRGVEAVLAGELRKMHCIGEGPHLRSGVPRLAEGWFDVEVDAALLTLPLRLCKACARAKQRQGTASWNWQEELKQNAHRLSPKIRRAIAVIQAAGHVPTAKGIAEEAGLAYPEVRVELIRAGLDKPRAGRMRAPKYTKLLGLAVFIRTLGLLNAQAGPLPEAQVTQLSLCRVRRLRHTKLLRIRALRKGTRCTWGARVARRAGAALRRTPPARPDLLASCFGPASSLDGRAGDSSSGFLVVGLPRTAALRPEAAAQPIAPIAQGVAA